MSSVAERGGRATSDTGVGLGALRRRTYEDERETREEGRGMRDAGLRRMADGGWRMADGGWRMADGGWRMAGRFPLRGARATCCPGRKATRRVGTRAAFPGHLGSRQRVARGARPQGTCGACPDASC